MEPHRDAIQDTGVQEYTVELETCPMVSLDADDLIELQLAAAQDLGLSDPVFALDESKGSVLLVAQVWAASLALAAALGCWLFFNAMVRAGFNVNQNDIEMIAVSKTSDGSERSTETSISVTLPDKERTRT